MTGPVRICYLEDDPRDVELVRARLEQAEIACDLHLARSRPEYEAALAGDGFDLILSDYSLPDYDGLSALALARERHPETPFILVSGAVGEERAVDCVLRGATDYVLKQRLERLAPAVRRAVKEAEEHRQRRAAEEALRASEERYRDLVENLDEIVFAVGRQGLIAYVSPAVERVLGYRPQELVGQPCLPLLHLEDRLAAQAVVDQVLAGRPSAHEHRLRHRDGTYRWVSTVARLAPSGSEADQRTEVVGTVTDITEHKQAQQQRWKLEAQLNQAQKLEAVARLAGGVSHDFNNMLSVILVHAELALAKLSPDDPLREHLEDIVIATDRSADIARQLLAFARQGVFSPRALDLNEAVEGMLKMLRRLVGEDVKLAWRPGQELWPMWIDPSQLNQILANLCVNARDAITDVGNVTIETRNMVLDQGDAEGQEPGEYVMLAVSDDGCGMDQNVIERIFEPFFTTKEVGKGTGLGLATVYGIVHQSGGRIDVYSVPSEGSTFKIYLPRHYGEVLARSSEPPADIPQGRGETILVAEDEPRILSLAEKILADLGYVVLIASCPSEALQLAEAHAGQIDLLLSDVVMPEMNGKELADRLQARHPGLRRLFMSGYTADVISGRGVLEDGGAFVQKPFSTAELAVKVRKALD